MGEWMRCVEELDEHKIALAGELMRQVGEMEEVLEGGGGSVEWKRWMGEWMRWVEGMD